MWMHRLLLDEFPAGFARLVDKGFSHCTGACKNFLRAYFPAKVRNGRIGVEGVKDSRKQSADRYIVEVFFARVKYFALLKDRAHWAVINFMDDVWHMALAVTDLNRHLRPPRDQESTETSLLTSIAELIATVLEARQAWPAHQKMSSYL